MKALCIGFYVQTSTVYCSIYGSRALSVAGPTVWKSLPDYYYYCYWNVYINAA